MERLFTSLTRAVEATPAIALAASFLWGILSVVLSPCHLSSIPLIVGFIGQQGRMSGKRTLAISSLFAGGILMTIAAVGAVTAAAGRMMGDVGRYADYFVARIFFLVGLHLLDIVPVPRSGPGRIGMEGKGLLPALALGLIFGVAVGSWTFACMAPMLAVTFRVASTALLYGIVPLVAMASAAAPSSSWPAPVLGSCSVISTGTRNPKVLSSPKECAATWSCSPVCA